MLLYGDLALHHRVLPRRRARHGLRRALDVAVRLGDPRAARDRDARRCSAGAPDPDAPRGGAAGRRVTGGSLDQRHVDVAIEHDGVAARQLPDRAPAGPVALADPAADQGRPRHAARSTALQGQHRRSTPARRSTSICPAPAPATAVAEDLPLTILYEDADLVVIDKPAGMVVHPAAGHSSGTLVNALLHHVDDLSGIGGELRPGIVHRLDRGHVGRDGGRQERRAPTRSCRGSFTTARSRRNTSRSSGARCTPGKRIDAPIGRDPGDRQKMSTRARRARSAVTRVIRAESPARRVAHPGGDRDRPHAPDPRPPERDRPSDRRRPDLRRRAPPRRRTTSARCSAWSGPFLHAAQLAFTHPTDGRRLEFESPLPADLQSVIDDDPREAGRHGGSRGITPTL